jgi:hypothetical protein
MMVCAKKSFKDVVCFSRFSHTVGGWWYMYLLVL